MALKILLEDGALGTEGKSRLLREARAAAALHDENVMSVFDVGEIGGAPFIAIEIVEGDTLRALVESASTEQKLARLLQVARALEAAHDAGLVHRDIKPKNVIIRAKDRVAKVLDFGIAKSAATFATSETADAALATVTAAGKIVGTPTYMAPEQLRAEPLDGRCDQFAWGVMAYELVARKLPWDAQDGLGTIAQVLSRDPEPLKTDGGALTEAVVQTIARAMRKLRQDRFASMGALMDALGPVGSASGSGSARAQIVAAPAISTARTERAERASTLRAEAAPAVASTRGDVPQTAAQEAGAPRRATVRAAAVATVAIAAVAIGIVAAGGHRRQPSDAASRAASALASGTSASGTPASMKHVSFATPPDACNAAARDNVTTGLELNRTGDWYEGVHRLTTHGSSRSNSRP